MTTTPTPAPAGPVLDTSAPPTDARVVESRACSGYLHVNRSIVCLTRGVRRRCGTRVVRHRAHVMASVLVSGMFGLRGRLG